MGSAGCFTLKAVTKDCSSMDRSRSQSHWAVLSSADSDSHNLVEAKGRLSAEKMNRQLVQERHQFRSV